MNAITVQESDQATIQIQNLDAFFPPMSVPFTIIYRTTDGTAVGRL